MSSVKHHYDNRWLAMGLLCMGALMIVLDVTIVNVALPSIRADLKFDDVSLAWVVNAYILIFGGFLLLGGRLGDLYGHRRVFLMGLALFTGASLACGFAGSQGFLIAARAVQGLGGAVVDAVSMSLIINLFTEPSDRTKAMGVYGFVCSGGGCIGALLGGVLTGGFNWHWIFLVNVPVGLAVFLACWKLLPHHAGEADKSDLDVGGAVTVTLALLLATYATINGNQYGWISLRTLGVLGASLVVFAVFIAIEAKVKKPLVPLAMFRLRNLSVASGSGILWAAAMFAWFFLSALYMQLVLC
jgi:MFS family permease